MLTGPTWRFLVYTVIALLVLLAFAYLTHSIRYITYPYVMFPGNEGFVLNQAWLFSQGHHQYHDITIAPFTTANYPPLYPLQCGLWIRLFGLSLAGGRVISLAASLLVGLLIHRITLGITGRRDIAIVSSLLFFACPYVYLWAPSFRPDTLGLLFSLLGVYVVFRCQGSRMVYLSALLFLLALYSKQSFVAAPVACSIFLFVKQGDAKVAVTNLALFVGLAALVFLAANWVTDGQFYLHLVEYNAMSFSISRACGMWLSAIIPHLILLSLAAYFLLRRLARGGERMAFLASGTGLFALYFMSSALMAFTAGKIGSSSNYFLEPLMAACILVGALLGETWPCFEKRRLTALIIAALILLQLPIYVVSHLGHAPAYDEQMVRNRDAVSEYIREAEGDVLSQDGGLAVLNGKRVIIEPFVFTELSEQGAWDQQLFLDFLENKRLPLIILDFDVGTELVWPNTIAFTPEMVEAINANYHLVDIIGIHYVYKPDPMDGAG